jgi:hypothetical protein
MWPSFGGRPAAVNSLDWQTCWQTPGETYKSFADNDCGNGFTRSLPTATCMPGHGVVTGGQGRHVWWQGCQLR